MSNILIDHRIGSKDLAPLIPDSALVTLDYADIAFAGLDPINGTETVMIGIERKRLTDMLTSMSSGRLSGHQLIGLMETFDYTYILVEGIYRTAPDGILESERWAGQWDAVTVANRRWTGRELCNFINTLQIICGIPVLISRDARQTAQMITWLYGWWQKTKHTSHKKMHTAVLTGGSGQPAFAKPKLVVQVAAQLPGVGQDRAEMLAEKFPTVLDLVLSSEEELLKVKGIGKKLARGIRDAMMEVG